MSGNTLWNNPMVNAARQNMTPEQKEAYKKMGEHIYGHNNFEEDGFFDDIEKPIKDAAIYLKEAVKSGLHPSMLNDNEKKILSDIFGEKWYEEFDYIEDDLEKIVTLK